MFTNLFCTLELIFEISLISISPKPSPKSSDVQLLSTRHVTKVHLLQKFLDPQKHALIDNILPICGNLSRFSFMWKNVCTKGNVFTIRFSFLRNPTEKFPEGYLCQIGTKFWDWEILSRRTYQIAGIWQFYKYGWLMRIS